MGELIDLAETLPFFAETEGNPGVGQRLFQEVEGRPGGIPVAASGYGVFPLRGREVDKRTKTCKAVQKAGRAVEFTMPDEKTLARWMGARLKQAKKTISRGSLGRISEADGREHGEYGPGDGKTPVLYAGQGSH